MKDDIAKDFQSMTGELLARNKSLIDSLSKYHETAARVDRGIAKAITHCGCIKLTASRQNFSHEIPIEKMSEHMSNHVEGNLCPKCKEVIERELGENLFYIAALCNALGLSMYDAIASERGRLELLGRFHMR